MNDPETPTPSSHTQKNLGILEPFWKRQCRMVELLAELGYPIQRFIADDFNKGSSRPKNKYAPENIAIEALRAALPKADATRSGRALIESGETLLELKPLQWLVVAYDDLELARKASGKTFAAQRAKFIDDFMHMFSYAVILAITAHVHEGPVKGCPLQAFDQLQRRRELKTLLEENEAARRTLISLNHGLIVREVARTMKVYGSVFTFPELATTGGIGLTEGINRYRPDYTSKDGDSSAGFAGGAIWWIKEVLKRYCQANATTIKRTFAHQETLGQVAQVVAEMPELSVGGIAEELVLREWARKDPALNAEVKAATTKEQRAALIERLNRDQRFDDEVSTLAKKHLKEALALPRTDSMTDEETMRAASAHACPNVTEPGDAEFEGELGERLSNVLRTLPIEKRVALAFGFSMDARPTGREYLTEVLRRSNQATNALLRDRPARPLPKLRVNDSLLRPPAPGGDTADDPSRE